MYRILFTALNGEDQVEHPSFKPFKCPHCRSTYFSSIFEKGELVGRYCKGWPSQWDRSYDPCPGRHEERYELPTEEQTK